MSRFRLQTSMNFPENSQVAGVFPPVPPVGQSFFFFMVFITHAPSGTTTARIEFLKLFPCEISIWKFPFLLKWKCNNGKAQSAFHRSRSGRQKGLSSRPPLPFPLRCAAKVMFIGTDQNDSDSLQPIVRFALDQIESRREHQLINSKNILILDNHTIFCCTRRKPTWRCSSFCQW